MKKSYIQPQSEWTSIQSCIVLSISNFNNDYAEPDSQL